MSRNDRAGILIVFTLALLTTAAFLSFLTWKVQNDIYNFQERIQLLQENMEASQQVGKSEIESGSEAENKYSDLALEKELAMLEKNGVELRSNSNASIFQALGTLAIFLGFISTWRNQELAEKNAAEAQRTANTVQITHRFTEAVNQLGSDKTAARLGGIYALQSIANESEDYSETVIRILCGYVRDKAHIRVISWEENSEKELVRTDVKALLVQEISVDIQSALNYIGQVDYQVWQARKDLLTNKILKKEEYSSTIFSHDSSGKSVQRMELDLSFVNLCRAKLPHKYFAEVNFRNTLLGRADFLGACLCRARFTKSILIQADFREADLRHASFKYADLADAKFANADLEGVNFLGATSIDIDQIKQAKNWQRAKFDLDICQQLGLDVNIHGSRRTR